MKKFFSTPMGKRVIVGILLIALAVILGIVLAGEFTGPDSQMYQRLIFIVCVIGVGFGGLGYIFLNWIGLVLGIGFVLIIALPRALPDPWNRYFSFLYLASLFGLPPMLQWLKKKKKPAASAKKATAKPDPQTQKGRRAILKNLRMGLLIAIGAIGLPWLFLAVPYKLFSILSLLPFPVAITVLCLCPEDISLEDKQSKKDSRVEFFIPLTFSGFAPCLRTLLDFNFLTWKPLLIYAGLLLVLIVVLLLVFYEEMRKRFWYFLGILFVSLFFCIGAVGQLNFLLDTSTPQRETAVITEMHISTGSKSPDSYNLTVRTEDGDELELRTSEEHYHSLHVGESVTVYIKEGGLGIPYAEAD